MNYKFHNTMLTSYNSNKFGIRNGPCQVGINDNFIIYHFVLGTRNLTMSTNVLRAVIANNVLETENLTVTTNDPRTVIADSS